MSVLPPEAKKAMTAVLAAMGGDDYNYYSDFSTTVASSGRASIIATFRVVVPQVQRQRATANLEKSLNKQKYTVVVQNNQIDVLINGTKKKIRINVKPPVGGTYSAAKKTAIAESGQAVYAQYVVDNPGITVDSVIDSAKLRKAYDKCVTTGASFEEIESMDPDWKKSSIMGALKLKTPYGQGYKYLRGGDMVEKVSKAFSKVKKAQGWYGDLNKWSPADIYIAKNGFTASQLQDELAGITTWETLNARMFELLKEKKFVGVSLKKMERGANLSDINFPTDKSTVDFKYEKMESPMTSTSGYLIMKKGPQEIKVNFRTFTSSGGFSGEVLGGSARHGKVGHGAMSNLLKAHGLEQLPDNPTSRRIAVQGDEKMAEWIAKTSKDLGLVNSNQEAEAEMKWLQGDTNYRQSKYLTVKLFEIINGINDVNKKNMLMEDMYRYASSTVTGVSGPYIKLS